MVIFATSLGGPAKTPYRDGTTHVIFERGGHPPNSKLRVRVTPAKRGRERKRRESGGENWLDKTPAERHHSVTWMQRALPGIENLAGRNHKALLHGSSHRLAATGHTELLVNMLQMVINGMGGNKQLGGDFLIPVALGK